MNILIADDALVSRRLLEVMLKKWGYEVRAVQNGELAWQALQEQDAPSLVILDWEMPGMDGPEVCKRIRERAGSPYTYVILLTARNDREDIVRGLDAGADDYLVKPVDPQELKVRLRAGQRIIDLQRSLLAAQEELRIQATRDPLTGLWNRGAILDILGREAERARRSGNPLTVAVADVDNFKKVNDTYGHPAGDEVLREVARRMLSLMRPYDSVGRYGGEEFLAVVIGCEYAGARAYAERLVSAVAAQEINLPVRPIWVTMSMGVAVSGAGEGSSAEALIQAADEALYRAKKEGKNRAELVALDGIQKRTVYDDRNRQDSQDVQDLQET